MGKSTMGKKTDLESVHLVNHSKCMLAAFQNFRQDETMLDVTLVCNGMSLKAHKLVLSACSPFFKDIFSENPCTHPIIILRHFEFSDLKAIIDFIYKGELSVPRERLMSALKVAEELHIRGLRRSEPNREKYEKLYNQVCGKLSGRKKRKRHRRGSSDSDGKVTVSASESEQNIVESEVSVSADEEVPTEALPMEVESACTEGNSYVNDKDVRPVVLRVGDTPTTNGEPVSKNTHEDEECNIIHLEESSLNDNSQDKNSTSQKKGIEDQICEFVSEGAVISSQFDVTCSENSNVSLGYVPTSDLHDFQEQNAAVMPVTEYSEKVGLISSSCLSSKQQETQQNDDTRPQDEGKRFICSKCDSSFTSRISFIRHKTLGHNNMEKKSPYECRHCNYTSEELDGFKSHLLTHSDKVPYKCSTCSEEFTSEELYKNHLSVHEVEKISLHGLSSSPRQDIFLTQHRNPEKIMEFRCSICFIKFASKLRCQIHEKMCQGGS